MKTLFIAANLLLACITLSASVDVSKYGELLAKYAVPTGVDYATWATVDADVEALDQILAEWSTIDVKSLSRSEQKAFYINLYNAAMLQAVFDNYPLKSVKSIGLLPFSIFKKEFIKLGDKKLSLDDIEKGILLKEYPDARIHFAVNCASESCPPLRTEPFSAQRLETQLDEQTREFAESSRAARVNKDAKTIDYSELFKWYSDDFKVAQPDIYLNQYRAKALPKGYKVGWIEYDWALNQSK